MKKRTESTRDSAYQTYSAFVMQGNTQREPDYRAFQAGLKNGGYSFVRVRSCTKMEVGAMQLIGIQEKGSTKTNYY